MTILGGDFSTNKLAVVCEGWDTTWVKAIMLPPKASMPQKTYAAYQGMSEFLGTVNLTADRHAFIEAPIVAGARNLQTTIKQAMVSGGAQTALIEWGFTVHLVPPASWKKEIIGKGNARKEQVGPVIQQVWRSVFEIASGDQDILDAASCCLYGISMVRRSERPDALGLA